MFITGIISAECVRGDQRVFHDEVLKKSLFFGPMCGGCSSANITAGGTRYPRTEPRPSVHTNMDMRSLLLPGFQCEEITRNFFLSQRTSIEQFLPRTLKGLFTTHFVTTIAKRRSPDKLGDPQPSPSPALRLTMKTLACTRLTTMIPL